MKRRKSYNANMANLPKVNGATNKRSKPALKKNPATAMKVSKYNFTVIFTPAEEGGYVVTCPVLPGLVTEGDTLEEARQMAREAVEGYLEVLIKDGRPIPQDNLFRAEQIGVSIPAFV